MFIEQFIGLDKFAWLGEFTALCVFFALAVKDRQATSSLIALTVMVIIGGATHQYAPHLLSITDSQYKTLVRVAWYLGFVLFDLLAIYAVYKLHQIYQMSYRFIAKMVILAYFCKALLHLTRFTERHFWDTDYLQSLYQFGIVAINVGGAVTVLIFAVGALYGHFAHKRVGGAVWRI